MPGSVYEARLLLDGGSVPFCIPELPDPNKQIAGVRAEEDQGAEQRDQLGTGAGLLDRAATCWNANFDEAATPRAALARPGGLVWRAESQGNSGRGFDSGGRALGVGARGWLLTFGDDSLVLDRNRILSGVKTYGFLKLSGLIS